MRKPLLPASKRPAQEVRQTRSVSANELKKKVKGNKKQTTGKSNDSTGSKTQSKDFNMTTKPKVAKKPSNTPSQNAGNAKPKTLIKEKPKLAKKFVKKQSLIVKKQTLDKVEKKKKAIGKKQANSIPSTSSNQQTETQAQSQQIREAEETENGETSSEPVEVVIHVKKPQNKTGLKKLKKTGPSSGKIGKRKISKQAEPAKSLIKNISGTSGKLETVVSTILEVAVLTKKITPPKPKPSTSKTIATKKPIKNKLQNRLEIKNVVEQNEKDSSQAKGKDSKEVKEKETKKDVEKKSGKDVKKESKLEKKDPKEEPVDAKEEKMKEAKKDPKSLKEDTIDNAKKQVKILKPKKSESKESKKVEIVKTDSLNVAEVTKQISKKKKCNEKIIKKSIKNKIKMSKPDDTKSSKKCAEEGKITTAPEKLVRKERSKSPTKTKKECNKRNVLKGKTVENVEEKQQEIIPVAETNIKGEESDDDLKTRRLKLFGFWEGPRRHREASLNALAKVHCLYENESRGAMMEMFDKSKQRVDKKKTEKPKEPNINETVIKAEPETSDDKSVKSDFSLKKEENTVTRRTLRTTPGMRSVGRHYDVETSSSSQPSSGDESDVSEKKTKGKQRHSSPPPLPSPPADKEKEAKEKFDVQSDDENKKKKEEPVKKVRKRRKRCELMMDLKDMVVRKRMASLNASAMLAATYSMEKRSVRGDGDLRKRGMRNSSDDSTSTDMDVETSDDEMIVSGSSKKVAVIVNQDTDVTITGLYVNSTTRSTRHCSITGMQYRISSTSHTQTESTAVTTETVIHTTDHVSVSHSQSGSSVEAVGSPGGSCKSYTPLGALSSMQPPGNNSNALMRRHPCSSSAFSAPYHPHQEIHGYYQPAGPLISHHHLHSTASTSASIPAVSGVSSSKGSPGIEPQSRPSETTAEPQEYRAPPGFPGAYPPPPYSYQYIPPAPYQDCYSAAYYHKYANYRRYWGAPPGPPSSQMVASDSYPLNQGGPLVDPFPPHPPPPPPHHSSYGVYTYSAGPPPPPPSCYNHPPTRGIPFIDPAFQCPCPMQSCPKNVHTGPLTGASKGSSQNIQAQTQQGGQGNQQNNVICLDQQQLNSQEAIPAPLPPVALALPLEPSGANLGPPSPARGSAGMPPPASPALSSTARNPPSWSPPSGHPVPIKEEDITPKELPTPPPEQTIVDIPVTENFLQRRMRPMKRKASIEHEIVMDPMMPMAQVLEQPMVKKRRAASPVLIHELMPQTKRPHNTIKCKEEIPIVNDNIRVPDSIIEDVKPPILDPPLLDLKLAQECKSEKKPIPQEKPAIEKKTPILEKPNEIKTHLDPNPNVEPKVQNHEQLVEEKIPSQEKIQEKKQTEKPQLTKKPERKPSVEKKVLTDKKNNTIPNKMEKKCKKKVSPKISIAQKSDTGIKQLAKKETQSTKIKHCKYDKKKANKKACLAVKKEVSTEYPLIRGQPTLKWSNGWSWEGEPFKAKVFLTSDEPVSRTCYPAMRHIEGDVICPRDCILLKSGPRKQQLPFVAKVTAMWENPDDGEMVVSLLWYYRPEHTEQGRLPNHPEDEIFASRHKDTNSVACIEDKCYVLTFNEYCRYKSNMKMLEAGVSHNLRNVVPDMVGDYPRMNRLPKGQVSKDILFFCRRVYDFRQKRLLKNP